MADTFDPLAALTGPTGFFFGKDKNDPRVNPALRQRLALAMLARQSKFPKNTGEGLAAIGEAIGDRSLMRQLMDADVGQQDQASALLSGGAAPGAAPPAPYAPPSPLASAPPVQAIDAAMAPRPGGPPAAQSSPVPLPPVPSQPPPPLANTPSQPSSMLSPNMPPPDLAGPEGQLATAPPDVQRSMMSPQPMLGTPMQTPPATGFNPPPPPSGPGGPGPGAEAPPADNPYNVLDAQIGYKRPAPSYISGAIARNVSDPDRQAYLGSLSGGEAPNGPADVSPTGADGPFQFTRGTGRQYGLIGPQGDQRRDLDASVVAANKLTDDNVATFQQINGRPPSPAEMAVMHQQGGTTGSRMIAGTGNAPAGNLAVNNISPGTSPAAAVAKIKAYYGMPDQVTPRDGVAGALLAQQRGGGGGQPAPPAQPAMAFSGIQPAPPDPSSAIRPMPPPTKLAQNGPPDPGFVTPQGVAPSGAPIVPMHPEEQRMRALLAANPNNEYLAKQAAVKLEPYVREREQRQKEADAKFKSDLDASAKQTEQHYKDLADQQKRIDEHLKAGQDRINTPTPASTVTDPRLLGTPQKARSGTRHSGGAPCSSRCQPERMERKADP